MCFIPILVRMKRISDDSSLFPSFLFMFLSCVNWGTGHSAVQQVVKLTSDLEESYEGRRNGGLVLVDLTAAFDTVWHQGLALKLLQTISDWHLVRFIVDISNRSFILRTSDGQCSGLLVCTTECPKGQRLHLCFNIHISDIPDTVSTQCGYADDLALLFSHKCWSEVEEVLSLDMQRIAEYLSAWRLRLSTAKTTCTAFHLNTRESSRKLGGHRQRYHHPLLPNSNLTWSHAWPPTHVQATLGRPLWQSRSP